MSVTVVPWPIYPDDGGAACWQVIIQTSRRTVQLVWSSRLKRFAKCWAQMNLRRSEPAEYRAAVSFMLQFGVTLDRDNAQAGCVTEVQRDVTDERDTLARARLSQGKGCHGVTRDSDTSGERDKCLIALRAQEVEAGANAPAAPDAGLARDSAPLCYGAVTPVSTEADRREKDRVRLAADPRFAAWAAGSRA